MELKVLRLTEDGCGIYVVRSAKSVWSKTSSGFMKTICGPHTATYNVKNCFYDFDIAGSAILKECWHQLSCILADYPLEHDEVKRAFDILWEFA